jgi:hypothetical protein
VGEQIQLHNATVALPDGTKVQVADGYMRAVAYVVTDQKGNIINDGSINVEETITAVSASAKEMEAKGLLNTSEKTLAYQLENGAAYDFQIRGMGAQKTSYETSQETRVRSGPRRSLFKVTGTQIITDDNTRSITIRPGKVQQFH